MRASEGTRKKRRSVALREAMAGLPEVQSWCLPPLLRFALSATARSHAAFALRRSAPLAAAPSHDASAGRRSAPLAATRCYSTVAERRKERREQSYSPAQLRLAATTTPAAAASPVARNPLPPHPMPPSVSSPPVDRSTREK
uniref:Uncharacterized protein n=1 Tax=Oryza nivara TaxID=4536 RepID=A0A0E0HEP6_ORYNI